MIQLNLLPDIKQKYIKTRRTRRLVSLICIISTTSVLGIVGILLMTTNVWQTRSINNLNDDIATNLKTLQDTPELSKILTVQEQLNGLDDLHNKKAAFVRMNQFLPQILPQGVNISDLKVNLDEQTLEIQGRTDSLEVINKFIDTLKFTDRVTFDVDEQTQAEINLDTSPAFSEVVLTGTSREDTKTVFTINLKYDPTIFDNSIKHIRLVVPNIITTRSQTELPGALFDSPQQGGN